VASQDDLDRLRRLWPQVRELNADERAELKAIVGRLPKREAHAMCCFCGGEVATGDAVTLALTAPGGGDPRQWLYAHLEHLRDAIAPARIGLVFDDPDAS
jgi:hypothetical protein